MDKDKLDNINENADENEDIIELEDETGAVMPYKVISSIEYNEKEYLMLQPCFEVESEEEDIVLIFRVTYTDTGDIELFELESEEEEEAVYNEFKLILGDEDYEFKE